MEEKNQRFTWGIISQYRGQIMGLSIFWIILYHGMDLGMSIPGFSIINYFLRQGSTGVELFLFLSAIGLYYSLSKGYTLKAFYIKRFKRVVIPYLLISLPFWIWQDLICKFSITDFLLDYSLLSFWTRGVLRIWFIALIIVLYLIAPFLFELFQSESHRKSRFITLVTVIIIALFLFRHFLPEIFDNIEIALTRTLIFTYGMYLAPKVKQQDPITLTDLLLLFCIFALWPAFVSCKIQGLPRRLFNSLLGVGLTFLFALWCHLFSEKKLVRTTQLLTLCGKYSLELYMTHVMIRRFFVTYDFKIMVNGVDWNYNYLPGYGLLIILSALTTFVIAQIKKIFAHNK